MSPSITVRLFSFAIAAVMTLSMLGSIDSLAQHGADGAVMAQHASAAQKA